MRGDVRDLPSAASEIFRENCIFGLKEWPSKQKNQPTQSLKQAKSPIIMKRKQGKFFLHLHLFFLHPIFPQISTYPSKI